MDFITKYKDQFLSWGGRLSEFSLWQVCVHAMQVACALMVVRMLPKQEYGWYSIANGLQGTMAQLTLLGTPALLAIGGKYVNDPQRLGEVVFAVKRWRKILFATLGPVLAGIYGWLLYNNGAPLALIAILLLLTGALLYCEIHRHVISAPLQLKMQFNTLQRIAFTGNVIRLGLLFLLMGLTIFKIIPVMAVSLLAVGLIPIFLTIPKSAPYFDGEAKSFPDEMWREIKQISIYSLPSTLTFMFSSQISLWVISIFGNVEDVANFGAMARLGLLIAIPMAIIQNIVIPKLASIQANNHLKRAWLMATGSGIMLALIFLVFVTVLSEQILWVFGENYKGLDRELVLLAGAISISLANGGFAAIIQAKAWFKQSWIRPILFTAFQVIGITIMPISTVAGVIGLMYFGNAANLLVDVVLIKKGFEGKAGTG